LWVAALAAGPVLFSGQEKASPHLPIFKFSLLAVTDWVSKRLQIFPRNNVQKNSRTALPPQNRPGEAFTA
jgi:hypothetical protein